MESAIKLINGKWTVNGKESKDWGILEIGLINTFFKFCDEETEIDFISTKERCKNFCKNKINELIVDCEIVQPTKVFDEAFNNPINQIDNFLSK